MKLKRTFITIAALLMALAVIPFLIPMGSYIAQIEQAATEKLGVPVKIESLHFAVLPTPRANIGGLVVGANDEIKIDDIAAVLDVTTLFSSVREISTLKLSQPVIKQGAFSVLGSLAGNKSEDTGPAPVALRRIEVDDAKLEMEGMNLPQLDAEILLGQGSALESARFTSDEGNLAIDVLPSDAGYTATINAEKWTLPVGPALVFDTFNANLEYAGSTLKFPKIDAALYKGKLTANGQLDWAKNWHLNGKFNTQGIEVGEVTRLFTQTTKVTGRISGDGHFNSNAKEAGKLGDALALNYTFNVTDGVLYGVDLVKAASLLVRQGQTGGETKFDELTGTLKTQGKQVALHPIKIVSGLIAANGNVKVMPDKKLDGKIDVDLKKGVSLVTVPLKISGTTENPSVLPTKAALAGGAAGTVLMGPLGTGLGVKAGSALDKLFGGDDE